MSVLVTTAEGTFVPFLLSDKTECLKDGLYLCRWNHFALPVTVREHFICRTLRCAEFA